MQHGHISFPPSQEEKAVVNKYILLCGLYKCMIVSAVLCNNTCFMVAVTMPANLQLGSQDSVQAVITFLGFL